MNAGNVGALDDLVTDDFIEHEQMDPSAGSGRDAVKAMMTAMRTGFPDLRVTVESIIAEGDLVSARTTWRGTHQGEFMGVPATGNPVEIEAIDFVRYRDGKATEHWGQTDSMSLMMQIGAMEPPG
jgi:steroid delta-isomerase-like uncharacterized protein